MSDLQQFVLFRAVVEPCDVAEMRPAAAALVGREFTFEPMWIIEPEDGSFHHGDWACRIVEDVPDVTWLASGDLCVVA